MNFHDEMVSYRFDCLIAKIGLELATNDYQDQSFSSRTKHSEFRSAKPHVSYRKDAYRERLKHKHSPMKDTKPHRNYSINTSRELLNHLNTNYTANYGIVIADSRPLQYDQRYIKFHDYSCQCNDTENFRKFL